MCHGGRWLRCPNPIESADPVATVVHDVPEAGQDATRCEYPGDLGRCDGHVEPVHGVSGWHGIDGCVRQRNRLGTVRQGSDIRQRVVELGQYRWFGFDRDDVGAQRDQCAGQLAGAGSKVQDSRAWCGRQRPAHRGRRVVRAVLVVGACRGAEGRGKAQAHLRLHPVTLPPLNGTSVRWRASCGGAGRRVHVAHETGYCRIWCARSAGRSPENLCPGRKRGSSGPSSARTALGGSRQVQPPRHSLAHSGVGTQGPEGRAVLVHTGRVGDRSDDVWPRVQRQDPQPGGGVGTTG